jgi:uncharacterized protein (TIGR03663 family)
MNRWLTLGLLLAAGLALGLRCPLLQQRPMHNDEAVNAVKFGELWQHGGYKYDPDEHHGPTLYYSTLAFGRVLGLHKIESFSEVTYRGLTILFGLGLILLLPLLRDGLGKTGTLWAAFFTAVSPALVFYSRYYIHEMLLVFFSLLLLTGGWRYWRTRKPVWIILAGLGAGLMDATKETFVFSLVAAALALGLNHFWLRLVDASEPPVRTAPINRRHLTIGVMIWLIVAVVFFSSFFTNPPGPIDSLRTYLTWSHRAGGDSPHIHPWYFYLHRLLFFHVAKGPYWSEAFILVLGIVATVAAFARKGLGEARRSFIRFLAFYAFGLMAVYSLIGYKTPWCLLTFWQPMILLAGVGAALLFRRARQKTARLVLGLVLLIGTGQLASQAWQANVPYAADPRNPYVYAQTSPDTLRLVKQINALADVHPRGRQMTIQVMAPENDYWPLPWYLREFKQVGWWDQIPANPFSPVMVVSAQFHANLDEKKTHLMVGYFQLRPQTFLELYVELDLWRAYLARSPTKPEN